MLDAGGGGGGEMLSVARSMVSFKAAATSGAFAVSAEGGAALLEAITNMGTWVDTNLARLAVLSRELPLGSSHGAELMKPYVQNVASDDQGFITQLKQFRDSLVDAEEGIRAAMANYRSTDTDAGGNFRAV